VLGTIRLYVLYRHLLLSFYLLDQRYVKIDSK
jgi:hypothetical protein